MYAGKFGAIAGPCDIPVITVKETINYIKNNLNPDVLFWTGDNSPHDRAIGQLGVDEAAICLNMTAQMLSESFPQLENDTFAIIGNHDVFPHWNFTSEGGGNQAADEYTHWWKKWLDNDASYELFRKNGYYSKQLRLIKDKIVKVIALNTESCDIENHFVYGVRKDPMEQMEFLRAELDFLELVGGLAIVTFHITPDDGCNHDFGVRYKAIMERYQHIIRMTLTAHTHTDLFKVAYSYTSPQAPVGVMTVCGGVTNWGGQPSFCVYELDTETLLPVERYTYAFNLSLANADGKITWVPNYTDFKRDYSLKDLSPS